MTSRGPPQDRACAQIWNLAAADGSGGEARFGLALGWIEEAADQTRPQTHGSKGETEPGLADIQAEVAAELGLAATLTLDQLAFRWRNFVWRNHPDRQPPDARERANARVAIANTLYDRARRELARRR